MSVLSRAEPQLGPTGVSVCLRSEPYRTWSAQAQAEADALGNGYRDCSHACCHQVSGQRAESTYNPFLNLVNLEFEEQEMLKLFKSTV